MQLAQYALMKVNSLCRDMSCMVNMMQTIRTSFLYRSSIRMTM